MNHQTVRTQPLLRPTAIDVYSYVAYRGHSNYGDDASVLYKAAYMVSLIWIKFGFHEDLHILHVKILHCKCEYSRRLREHEGSG